MLSAHEIDIEKRVITAVGLVSYGKYNLITKVQTPLPVLLPIYSSYKSPFMTCISKTKRIKVSKRSHDKNSYKLILKVFNAKELGVYSQFRGLPGSPTIVYKVEKIPKIKSNRSAHNILFFIEHIIFVYT